MIIRMMERMIIGMMVRMFINRSIDSDSLV